MGQKAGGGGRDKAERNGSSQENKRGDSNYVHIRDNEKHGNRVTYETLLTSSTHVIYLYGH